MRVVICTLLFTFLVLFNAIVVHSSEITPVDISQSIQLRGRESVRYHRITLPHIPAGHWCILPNGNIFRSLGVGNIVVEYNERENIATVRQGISNPLKLGPGPFREHHYSRNYTVVPDNRPLTLNEYLLQANVNHVTSDPGPSGGRRTEPYLEIRMNPNSRRVQPRPPPRD